MRDDKSILVFISFIVDGKVVSMSMITKHHRYLLFVKKFNE